MSIPVPLEELAAAVEEFGSDGYLMTVGDDGRPRVNHVRFAVVDGGLRVGVGRRTAAALRARPLVSCLWPPVSEDGMNLIVDGAAVLAEPDGDPGDELAPVAISVTWAVRHVPPRRGGHG